MILQIYMILCFVEYFLYFFLTKNIDVYLPIVSCDLKITETKTYEDKNI